MVSLAYVWIRASLLIGALFMASQLKSSNCVDINNSSTVKTTQIQIFFIGCSLGKRPAKRALKYMCHTGSGKIMCMSSAFFVKNGKHLSRMMSWFNQSSETVMVFPYFPKDPRCALPRAHFHSNGSNPPAFPSGSIFFHLK